MSGEAIGLASVGRAGERCLLSVDRRAVSVNSPLFDLLSSPELPQGRSQIVATLRLVLIL